MNAELTSTPMDNIEPLKNNRWIIRLGDIEPYLFDSFDITTKTENGKIVTIFNTSILSTVHRLIIPDDVITTTKIWIDFLDGSDAIVDSYDMSVIFDAMNLIGNYKSNQLLRHHVSFYIKSIKTNASEEKLRNAEKNVLNNYNKQNDKK